MSPTNSEPLWHCSNTCLNLPVACSRLKCLKSIATSPSKKLKLPPEHIRAQLDLYELFEIVLVTPAIIRSGLQLHQTRSLAFYDALVLASAQAAGCTVLYTEDMNTNEVVDGVRIVNPLLP